MSGPSTLCIDAVDCPICLEEMNASDVLFTLPCTNCDYNFCSDCVETFVRSSEDDYQEASDGSRQVKVYVACPQCRSKYPMEIQDVLLLRQAYTLSNSLFFADGKRVDDSELSATNLSLKRDFFNHAKQEEVRLSHGLYYKVMKDAGRKLSPLPSLASDEVQPDGSANEVWKKETMSVWDKLFEGLPERDTKLDEIEVEYTSEMKGRSFSPSGKSPRRDVFDDTLFQGLHDCMGKDEKVFLSQLLTSGEVPKLSQAAMILHGILKLSYTDPAIVNRRMTLETSSAKILEKIEQTKIKFPLPNHMPGYFVIPPYDSKMKYMSLQDFVWDGTIIPPQRSKRIFDKVYGDHYVKPSEARTVVIVKSVRGPVGRVGLRRSDVVTHVNDMEWTGNAAELTQYIYQQYQLNPNEEMTLTVNANHETGSFLAVRNAMIEKSKLDII